MKLVSTVFKLSLLTAMIGWAFSVNGSGQTKPLTNADGFNYLRETGDYDSLRQAFDEAQTDGGATGARRSLNLIKFSALDGAKDGQFGISVAVDGNTAIVGASSVATGTFGQGSAYIFVKNGTMWTQQQKLLASGGMPSDAFGYTVPISGDTAIVGARLSKVRVEHQSRRGIRFYQKRHRLDADSETSRFGRRRSPSIRQQCGDERRYGDDRLVDEPQQRAC